MSKLVTFNRQAKRYETVTDLQPGMSVVKMYWCKQAQKFVTVPGASLFKVNQTGELELVND